MCAEITFWTALKDWILDEQPLQGGMCRTPVFGCYTLPRHRAVGPRLMLDHGALRPPARHDVIATNEVAVRGTLCLVVSLEALKEFDYKRELLDTLDQQRSCLSQGGVDEMPIFFLVVYADLKSNLFYYLSCFPALAQLPYAISVSSEGPLLLQSTIVPPHNMCSIIQPSSSLEQSLGSDGILVINDPSASAKPSWLLRQLLPLCFMREWSNVVVYCQRSNETPPLFPPLVLECSAIQPWSQVNWTRGTGWELNSQGKAKPKTVDLSALMDPAELAASSLDMNLRLMRWRMVPDLNLESLQSLQVLIIGAGTLGCNIARVLLGWGIRRMDIVDSGYVSYSNPTRQSLFTCRDATEAVAKAHAAATHLQKINPSCDAKGHLLAVPMPGHPPASHEEESVCRDVEILDALVRASDVVFTLTDSRESRWLPTVMAAAHDTLLISASLGFDSFLVIRHGGHPATSHVGCYFCSDVVAPMDSLSNRTLDRQCTVTRPGLSPIAASMAAELLVSILHHPDRHHAKAPASIPSIGSTSEDMHALGLIPHQIRGHLTHFQQLLLRGDPFPQCVGCSLPVVDTYRQEGAAFVLNATQLPGSYLEQVSGLAALKEATWDDWDHWDDI